MVALRFGGFVFNILGWLCPILLVVIGICIEHVPLGGAFGNVLLPGFGIMFLFAFCIRKVTLMPHWLTFLLLLFAELYAGAVPGTIAISGLVVRFILYEQREFFSFAPFFAIWAAVGVLFHAYFAIHWFTIVGFHLVLFDPVPLLIRALVTTACFPMAFGIVHLVVQFFWPMKLPDERSTQQKTQYLQPGIILPQAAPGARSQQESGDRPRFRPIRPSKNRKPWMEL